MPAPAGVPQAGVPQAGVPLRGAARRGEICVSAGHDAADRGHPGAGSRATWHRGGHPGPERRQLRRRMAGSHETGRPSGRQDARRARGPGGRARSRHLRAQAAPDRRGAPGTAGIVAVLHHRGRQLAGAGLGRVRDATARRPGGYPAAGRAAARCGRLPPRRRRGVAGAHRSRLRPAVLARGARPLRDDPPGPGAAQAADAAPAPDRRTARRPANHGERTALPSAAPAAGRGGRRRHPARHPAAAATRVPGARRPEPGEPAGQTRFPRPGLHRARSARRARAVGPGVRLRQVAVQPDRLRAGHHRRPPRRPLAPVRSLHGGLQRRPGRLSRRGRPVRAGPGRAALLPAPGPGGPELADPAAVRPRLPLPGRVRMPPIRP